MSWTAGVAGTHKRFLMFFFFNLFYFLNYENMITRLQETWKTQYKVKIFSWTLSL